MIRNPVGGAGGGMSYVIGSSCDSSVFLGCFMEPAASTLGGLVLGAVAGTVTGAFFGPRRWQTVPLSWLNDEGVPADR